MKDRIIKFLTHENITATKFADEIGVQRSSISHILSGRNNPSYDFIQKILARYKQLNAEWLLTGNGSMIKKSEQHDLFSQQIPENKQYTQENKILKEEQKPIYEMNLHSNTQNVSKPIEPDNIPSRKVEKIVLFYSDKTFDEFFPVK